MGLICASIAHTIDDKYNNNKWEFIGLICASMAHTIDDKYNNNK